MSTGVPPSNLDIHTTTLHTAPSITPTPHQRTLLTSLLDLFAGRPSLAKLSLWRDDATFSDPLTIATGRDRYAAQWYGLAAAFSEIEQRSHEVVDVGNPMRVMLETRYVVKGLGKETVVKSEVRVWVDGEGRIERIEDRWDGKLPEGAVAEAFRKLNAVTVPKIVSVPKNAEEDSKTG